jgi:hypothetical protein
MADAIYGLITYPALSKMFRERGQAEVNTLKWDKAAEEVARVYQSVL